MNLRNFCTDAVRSSRWNVRDIPVQGYKRVTAIDDPSGLRAIVAIDTTKLGPALGGLRILPYQTFDAALTDVSRLARGMSHKSALAGIGLGGGKSVIISDPKKLTPEMLKVFASFLNYLEGDYITAEDSGSTVEMIDFIGKHTPYVTGLSHAKSSGNPSPFTAWGVFRGIQATCQVLDGKDSVRGKTVAIQGLGSVGASLAELLFWHGARLVVADTDPTKTAAIVKKYNASSCPPETIHKQACDILAPCALGGTLNAQTIPELRCRAIAGCANNQLLVASDADSLQKRKILYAPDFAINAGGIINISFELGLSGYQSIDARDAVDRIYDTVREIFSIAKKDGITTHKAAVSLAESKIQAGVGARTAPPRFHHWPSR
jgi:leucine dehydrogenase